MLKCYSPQRIDTEFRISVLHKSFKHVPLTHDYALIKSKKLQWLGKMVNQDFDFSLTILLVLLVPVFGSMNSMDLMTSELKDWNLDKYFEIRFGITDVFSLLTMSTQLDVFFCFTSNATVMCSWEASDFLSWPLTLYCFVTLITTPSLHSTAKWSLGTSIKHPTYLMNVLWLWTDPKRRASPSHLPLICVLLT